MEPVLHVAQWLACMALIAGEKHAAQPVTLPEGTQTYESESLQEHGCVRDERRERKRERKREKEGERIRERNREKEREREGE